MAPANVSQKCIYFMTARLVPRLNLMLNTILNLSIFLILNPSIFLILVGRTRMLCDVCELIQLRPTLRHRYGSRQTNLRATCHTAYKAAREAAHVYLRPEPGHKLVDRHFCYRHHSDLQALRDSAGRGCQLCRQLYAGLRDARSSRNGKDPSTGKIILRLKWNVLRSDLDKCMISGKLSAPYTTWDCEAISGNRVFAFGVNFRTRMSCVPSPSPFTGS